ncbi:hypothetical protein TNCV_138151 [Trichonephila clavipes]|nr:hypothetical protein TNCV_138151 [Trichonephila clavipes]
MSERSHLPNSFRLRVVGWMEVGLPQVDAARRLNVPRSRVHNLGLISTRIILKTCSRLTTSYNTFKRPFYRSFGPKEKIDFCETTCCRPFCCIRKRNIH